MIVGTVRVDVDEILARMLAIAEEAPEAVRRAVVVSIEDMIAHVIKTKMTRANPPYLNVDTGTARRSVAGLTGAGLMIPSLAEIHSEAELRTKMTDVLVRGAFGSPLGYVKAHEVGFAGAVKVRAHARRVAMLVRNDRTGKVTKKSAMAYKARLRARGKTTAFVRAHDRKVNIRAKHFFRDTVTERTKASQDRVIHALRILSRTGVLPTFGQLGA